MRFAAKLIHVAFFCALAVFVSRSGPAAAQSNAEKQTLHNYRRLDTGQIVLKNGRRLEGRVSYQKPAGAAGRLLYVGEKRERQAFLISEVRAFRHGGQEVLNYGFLEGRGELAVTERLIERRVSGRIDLYAAFDKAYSRFPYAYFSKGNLEMKTLTYKNLRTALQDDPESMAYLARARRWQWAQRGLLVGGVAIGTYRTAMYFKYTGGNIFKPDGAMYLSLGVAALSLVPYVLKQTNIERAVRAYLD